MTTDTSTEAVERLARRLTQPLPMLQEQCETAAATLRALLAERDRLREALRLADGAVNAAYAQAHAEHAGHSTTEAKCEATITAFRVAARAALEDRA